MEVATLDTWTDTQKRQWVLDGEGEGSDRKKKKRIHPLIFFDNKAKVRVTSDALKLCYVYM